MPLTIDYGQLEADLRPIVNAVMQDVAKDKLPVLEQDDDEAHSIAVGMLNQTIKHLIVADAVADVNAQEIAYGEEPEVACLRGKKLRVTGMLGEGAFGRVFAIDRTKAVKITKLQVGRTSSAYNLRKDYDREIAMSRRAAELGVGPAVIDSFVCTATHQAHYGVLIMKLVRGIELSKWELTASKAKKQRLAKRLEALVDKMHAGNLYHNDLHPGNIMVTKGDVPVMIDFGLATADSKGGNRWAQKDAKNRHGDFRVVDNLLGGNSNNWWRDAATRAIVRHVVIRAMSSGVLKIEGLAGTAPR